MALSSSHFLHEVRRKQDDAVRIMNRLEVCVRGRQKVLASNAEMKKVAVRNTVSP